MTLDQELLAKAIAAHEAVSEWERRATLARADYHTMIRRLHLAGGSLREIAEALGLSYQRVQQIVSAAGGTWWTRLWRNRTVKRDAVCTFCERPPSELAKLVAGPDVYICDECLTQAELALRSGATTGSFAATGPGSRAQCSFCGKRRVAGQTVTAPAGNVCGECLQVVRDVIAARES